MIFFFQLYFLENQLNLEIKTINEMLIVSFVLIIEYFCSPSESEAGTDERIWSPVWSEMWKYNREHFSISDQTEHHNKINI